MESIFVRSCIGSGHVSACKRMQYLTATIYYINSRLIRVHRILANASLNHRLVVRVVGRGHMQNQGYDPSSFWDNRARVLGDLGDSYSNRVYHNYEDRIRWLKSVSLLGELSGQKIFDVGCGTGRWSIRLAAMGSTVIGLDISSEMIGRAVERARLANIVNARFINGRIDDVGLVDDLGFREEFNLVLSITVLQHIVRDELLEVAVRNIERCLTSGGRALVVECASDTTRDYHGRDMGIEHMRVRSRRDWTEIFRRNGLELMKLSGVSFLGRRFMPIASKFGRVPFYKKVEKLVERVDTNESVFQLLQSHYQPKMFLFMKG